MNHKPNIGQTTAKEAIPLQTSKPVLPEAYVRKTWLHYYNDYLRAKNLITDEEWRRMRQLIEAG